MKKYFLLVAVTTALFGAAIAREGTAFTLDATRAELLTPVGPVTLNGLDGLFDRRFIAEKGSVRLRVTVPALPGAEVSIAAPNGGNLTRSEGKLRFTPQQTGPTELDL